MNNSKLSKKSLKSRSLKLKNKRTKKSKKSKVSRKNVRNMKGGVLSRIQRQSMAEFFKIQETPNKNYTNFINEMIEYYKNEEGTDAESINRTLSPLIYTNQGIIDGQEYFNVLMTPN